MGRHEDLEGLTLRLKAAKSDEERDQLWEELFPKLRAVAQRRIGAAGQRGSESPTELVNDVFPGLQRALDNPNTSFESRGHFFAYAAQTMRRHLAARAKRQVAEELLDDGFAVESASLALRIALNEALDQLTDRYPRAVRAFELREYGGHSYEQIVDLMSDDYRTTALVGADLTLVRKSLVEILRSPA